MQFNFIHFLKHIPFSRLIFPLIAGILIALNFTADIKIFGYFLISFFILFLLGIKFIYKSKNFKHRWIPGVLLNILLILGGAILLQVNKAEKIRNYNVAVTGEAVISEPITEKENSYKSILKNVSFHCNDTVINEYSDLVVYFSKYDKVNKLNYGDKIIFKGRISEIKNSGNPYEFDYKKYLACKGIVGQVFLKSNSWKYEKSHQGNFIFEYAFRLRNRLENIYERFGITGNKLSVLQALTLGDRSEIDDEIKQAYVASGAMHILAVSGLHVGIIFMLFNFLLKFLDRLKYKDKYYGKFIKAFLLLGIIWSFAILSGLSPSIRRAAIMFSVIIIAKAINRHVNIYNSISASAFILLIINPYQITEVGFQLSYTAVIGIVFFQPKLVALLKIRNKILYYFWSLTAVSIAAQISTFPITLYYFHVFPSLFFLSNIIVIPTATLIIISAFFLLISSPIPYIPDFIALILKYTLQVLNTSVTYIEKIPYSIIQNISFRTEDLIIAFLIIISASVFILMKKVKALQISLILLIIWIGLGTINKISDVKTSKIFIYNINKFTAIDVIGQKNYFISDKSILKTKSIIYGIHPNRQYLNKSDFQLIPLDTLKFTSEMIKKTGNLIIIGNKSLIIADEKFHIPKLKKKIKVNFVIITGRNNVNINVISKYIDFNMIIIDSSNNFRQNKKLTKKCKKLNLNYYSVKDSGAFNLTF